MKTFWNSRNYLFFGKIAAMAFISAGVFFLHACKEEVVLSISGFSPAVGPEGETVTISGSNFSTTPENNIVKFTGVYISGISAKVTAATPSSLTVTVPVGAIPGEITVISSGHIAVSTTRFDVILPPSLVSFSPTFGIPGTVVTIVGNYLSTTPSNNIVKFNGVQGTVTSATATELKVVVPQGVTTGKISLQISTYLRTTPSDFSLRPTITDIDGNLYSIVTIGTQVWTGENLRTTKYRNGDIIGTTTPWDLDISAEANPKYQWPNQNNSQYGSYYTWYAVTDSRNLCPAGWHVPSKSEWQTLLDTNSNLHEMTLTGFGGLPAGHRVNNLNLEGYDVSWWSIDEYNTVWGWVSGYGNHPYDMNKKYGASVRCLKD